MITNVTILRDEGLQAPDDDEFSCWVDAALRASARQFTQEPELSLKISGIDEMAVLNRTYRGKDGATNVLSFPAELPEGVDCGLLGDVVICAPIVQTEAAEQQKTEHQHWAHLTIHGTLHLLGFDHQEEAEAQTMEQLEVAILTNLGFPDPYQYPPGTARVPMP